MPDLHVPASQDSMEKPRPHSNGATAPSPRAGWADAARQMHSAGDDLLLDLPQSSTFDDHEWEWQPTASGRGDTAKLPRS